MRPAAWPALILAGVLCVTCPALPAAVLAIASWVLFTPLAAAAALAVTLMWIAVRPEGERRMAR
ncbi:hypothetical protein GKJPGBOP_00492 [Streptomyces paromomycinus]|uniref:Uncharacterized protein n=1 Tax=Streptomyces paromomycinus TaxID=92743 RepID=A0A401VUV1_STREY|nr:hypothetical protein GKJPGBOP_00492 [Streptomyces paromomycinus]